MKRFKYCHWLIACPLLVLVLSQLRASEAPAKDPLVVFLVRHAAKVDAGRDPKLSAAGNERAKELANLLRDANVTHVHSSDFIRTRDTAAPIAAILSLKVELYDPQDLPSLVNKLRQAGGRHLIVGHSTSTPAAVELLGGQPGKEINEADEFDRLYIVTADASNTPSTVLMRYGMPFNETRIEQELHNYCGR